MRNESRDGVSKGERGVDGNYERNYFIEKKKKKRDV
jgi:hypothetical protein